MIAKNLLEILDNMMEGCQIIDYDWRYLYVNNAVAKHGHTTKEKLLGKTMMDAYPGIKKTEMFSVISRCIKERVPAQIENEFTYPNGEKSWFDLRIQPVPEGIFILSIDITERKKAEEMFRANELKYTNLFESMAQGAFYQKADAKLIDINQAALDFFGLTRSEFLTRDSYDLNWKVIAEDGEYLPAEKHPSMVALKTGKEVKNVVVGVFNPKKNRYVWMNVNAKPQFRDGENKPYQVFVTLHDITERKKAEEKLKQSEERYRTLFENTGTAMCIIEEDKTFSLVNREFEKLLGYSMEELKKKKWTDFVTKEHLDRMKKYHEARRKKGGRAPKQYMFNFINKNGQTRNALLTIDMISGTKRSVASIIDVTEHKKAEELLQEEKEKFETYLNLVRVIMLAIDAEGIVTYINRRGCKVLGYKTEEIVGKAWFSNFLPERIAKKTKKYLKNLLAGQMKPVEYNENPVLTKSGEERIIAWHNILLRDQNGTIIGTLSSGKDITKLKKTQQDMKELSYRLNGINPGECYISEAEKKLLTVFAYSVVYGRPGLCITRKNPEMLTKKYSLKSKQIRLLSSTPIKGFQTLSNLQEVSLEISNFLKNGGGIVLLDDLEYLVSRFGFNSVYSMLQEKRFDFIAANSVLLIPVNFEALTSQERALLASEFKTLT